MLASPATKKLPGANWRRFTKSTDLTVGSRRGIPHQQVEHHRHGAKDRDALGLEQPKRRTPLEFLIVPRARPDALGPLRAVVAVIPLGPERGRDLRVPKQVFELVVVESRIDRNHGRAKRAAQRPEVRHRAPRPKG